MFIIHTYLFGFERKRGRGNYALLLASVCSVTAGLLPLLLLFVKDGEGGGEEEFDLLNRLVT